MATLIHLREQTKNLTQDSNDYKENVIQVCLYVSAVLNSQLPSLEYTIPEWDEFSAALVKAKSDALVWADTVLSSLLATPQAILNVNQTTQNALQDAINSANFLIDHPHDQITKDMLTQRINQLIQWISINKEEVSGTLDKLRDFSEDLPQQSQNLESIADQASQGAEVDRQKVLELGQDIKDLGSEIASLVGQIVALGIADVACITLGTVAVAVAGPFGLITWPFLGIAAGVATTFIVLDGLKIAADKEQIEQDQSEINSYTQDAAILTAFANSFTDLSNQAIAIQDNMQKIIDAWTVCENDLQAVLDDLNATSTPFEAEQWQEVETDLESSLSEWNQMIDDIGPLAITIDATDADLSCGMSSKEVEQAVDKAGTMGFIEYLQKIA